MERRPRIGLTMRLEIATRRFYLGRDYCEALEAFGALPVHIPLIPKADFIDSVVDGLDGILLPGSDTDVDPALYGADPHPKLKTVIPEKDETERLVLAAAERSNKPVFAICYGMQALNVSRGGSLVQDIHAEIPESLKHEQGSPLARESHRISVLESTFLSSLVQDAEVKVNSHHHQAIDRVGKDLVASAIAPDGVVECIEDTRPDRFVVGVQWHPELSWESNHLSAALFRSFVAQCTEAKPELISKDAVYIV